MTTANRHPRNRSALATAACLLCMPWYTQAAELNLIVNGDFSQGAAHFLSQYQQSATNTAEGQYVVTAQPAAWNSHFLAPADHSPSADGQMLVANGDARPGVTLWQSQAIAVSAGVRYYFEAWAHNLCCNAGYAGGNSPAVLEFSVQTEDGRVHSLGTLATDLADARWQPLATHWDADQHTAVVLSIINQNTAVFGNDFALDDIHFASQTSLVPEPVGTAFLALGLLGLCQVARGRACRNTRQGA